MGFVVPNGSQYVQGMTRQLLIDTANRRTGMIAEGKLNLDGEYLDALQSFCLERQWWWRKKTVVLNTEANVAVYDMAGPFTESDDSNSPGMVYAAGETVSGSGTNWTLAHPPVAAIQLFQELEPGFASVALIAGTDYTISGAAITTNNSIIAGRLHAWYYYGRGSLPILRGNALDCQKMIKVQRFTPAGEYATVPPIFGDDDIQAAIEDPATGVPTTYFFVPGSTSQIQISPIPDDVYKLRLTFWAVPNGTVDTLADMIPLVPAHLQRVLMLKLQCNFLEGAGTKDSLALLGITAQKYQIELAKAAAQRDYADGRIVEWKSQEDAIQSH